MSDKPKLYATRDIEAQGDAYIDHVMAMTTEGLHSKSDIAAELAHRDIALVAVTVERDKLKDGEAILWAQLAERDKEHEQLITERNEARRLRDARILEAESQLKDAAEEIAALKSDKAVLTGQLQMAREIYANNR
jgi:hypothetical protein